MPKVDTDKCIDCHKCEHTCPSLPLSAPLSPSIPFSTHLSPSIPLSTHLSPSIPSLPLSTHQCHAAYHQNPNIRHHGSSGSIFYALASTIIAKGGIVYGASLDDNLQLKHTRATDIEGVKAQMKSKYIQSDTSGVYRKVINDLKNDKEVLFVGTPCQCQALHNLTPTNLRTKLLLADFVCHGVPSQSLFNQSIKQYEKDNNCKVINFSFREKTDKDLRNIGIDYITKDGIHHHVLTNPDTFPYCYGFFYHYTQRNSCYSCKMRTVNRSSDLTLADFWGIDKIKTDISDFQKGYSMIVTNTQKGADALTELKDCNIQEIENGLDFCIKRNHAYTKADTKSLMRTLFFWSLRNFGYKFAQKHFLQMQPSLFDRLWHSAVFRIDRIIQ